MNEVVGRDKEVAEIQKIYQSKKSEFLVVFGRRRVGKTYLISELFKKEMCFYHTGLSPIENQNTLENQLQNFCYSLIHYGLQINTKPKNWLEAFELLISLLSNIKTVKNKRRVIFIDEMPWMDTPKSGFMTGFEHFWNGWASRQKDILLIVCGSATSWITDKLINNHGGLYNRVTREIKLSPFTLAECKEYYKTKNISFDTYDQIQNYMIMGGIPYYLDMLEPNLSLAQNIDNLFFKKNSKLRLEYNRLFSSIFINAEGYKNIVKCLAQKRIGFTRKEIAEITKIPYGGGLSNMLNTLEINDLIISYIPFGLTKKDIHYKLIDSYCLFYNYFESISSNSSYWQKNNQSSKLNSWRGFAFEEVCYSHINKIKEKLGISGIQSEVYPYIQKASKEEDGVQIDMVIERTDRVLNLCEIKFYTEQFKITKQYDEELRHKYTVLSEMVEKRKKDFANIHLTFITTFGLKSNEYSSRILNVITGKDLINK
ncbi:MAG: ATP-binding protein [Bacteroidales bacterium]|nr:ATP-binding protein [Bacteroidales bacterium]